MTHHHPKVHKPILVEILQNPYRAPRIALYKENQGKCKENQWISIQIDHQTRDTDSRDRETCLRIAGNVWDVFVVVRGDATARFW